MGVRFDAICEQCGHRFTVDDGGGFTFHVLRCDRCGRSSAIGFQQIGEAHLRYVKGLKTPYCLATAQQDRKIQSTYRGEPLCQEAYHAEVERMVGRCDCGGQYRFDAPIRCPRCRSERVGRSPDGGCICYD